MNSTAKAPFPLTVRLPGLCFNPEGWVTPSDVASALEGLERGPFLLGMACMSGDDRVRSELTRYVHLQIVVGLAGKFSWHSRRGDFMWRRLAALAVFEALNGERCPVCNGRGSSAALTSCAPCRGTGRFKIGESHRAWAVGISRKTWHSHWSERYAVVRSEMDDWTAACLTHVRLRMGLATAAA